PNSLTLSIRPPPSGLLFPYTTLFRSKVAITRYEHRSSDHAARVRGRRQGRPVRRTGIPLYTAISPHIWKCCFVGLLARCSCGEGDRKSTRLNSSHVSISYAVFCLKKN